MTLPYNSSLKLVKTQLRPPLIVLDLFSGAGGLSEGFFKAGYKFVGHIEMDSYACETLKTRSAYWYLKDNNQLDIYYDYLLKKISRDALWNATKISNSNEVINEVITDGTFKTLSKKIEQNLKEKSIKNVDIIIGGPPCQAYSIIGRSVMKDSAINDHRNFLYKYYVQFLKKFKPKMFIFENVPGILSAGNGQYFKDLKEAIQDAGYHLEYKELISSDYGVLQKRKRIIIVGWRKQRGESYKDDYTFPNFETINNTFLVEDVLKDLPKLTPGEKIEGSNKYKTYSTEYLIYSEIRPKNFNILTQHETRGHNQRDREIYKEAITAWNKTKEKLSYKKLAERRPELITHKNIQAFTDRFNVIKANESASHTILAHIAKDGHYYIHPDIKQSRSLSIREAARLQSFPDNFYFEGPRTAVFRQIGNAVPPKMAEQIAKKIKELI